MTEGLVLQNTICNSSNPLALRALPLSHLRWAEGEDWKSHFEQFYPFGALWVFSSLAVPPVTLQGVAKPYRGRWHIVTEGLENTDSGNNRVRQINLLCSKPELYPLSSMKNWSGGEREMQSISFAKIMRQKGIKPPPLCFVAKQNIGEVSLSDGGVRKYRQWRQQNSES